MQVAGSIPPLVPATVWQHQQACKGNLLFAAANLCGTCQGNIPQSGHFVAFLLIDLLVLNREKEL